MKVYIDSDFKCHASNPDGAYREVESDFFDGKSEAFIEGYRFVPAGEQWVRGDGRVFSSGGDMISPCTDVKALENAQREYEKDRLADAENALAILLGGSV